MENENSIQKVDNASIEMDCRADKKIWSYSIIAASTSFIPYPILDMVGDSLLQYKMIIELKEIYCISESINLKLILAAILDNLVFNKIFQKIGSILKVIPAIGTISGSLIQLFFKFTYTYALGKTFKSLFRIAYLEQKPVDFFNISNILKENINEAYKYVKNNFMNILFSSKHVLEKYEVDLKKLAEDIEENNLTSDLYFEKTYHQISEAISELNILKCTTDEFFNQLDKIDDNLKMPTFDFIKSKYELAKMQDKEIDPEIEALIEMLDNNKMKELLNIDNIK